MGRRRLRFSAQFPADLGAALAKYQLISPSRAAKLRSVISRRLAEITAAPNSFPTIDGDRRFARLHGFPYLVIIEVSPKSVRILGLKHISSDPSQWLGQPDRPE